VNIIEENNTVRIELGSNGDSSKQFKWVNPDNTTFFLNPDLMERGTSGTIKFEVGKYLEKYHPTEHPKYLAHCQRFNAHFEQLDNLIYR